VLQGDAACPREQEEFTVRLLRTGDIGKIDANTVM